MIICVTGPCKDGSERDEAGLCTDCKKGEYRKSTESHVCLECDPQTTTSGTGATDKSECVGKKCIGYDIFTFLKKKVIAIVTQKL